MYPGSRWNLKNDQSEQLIPEPGTAIQHIDIDPVGQYMAVVNSKVYILFYITPPPPPYLKLFSPHFVKTSPI